MIRSARPSGSAGRGVRAVRAALAPALLLPIIAGCPSAGPKIARTPAPPMPMSGVISRVEENAQKITAALRAIGVVDGEAKDADNRRRTFSLDGIMFYLDPSYLRFDLKRFGERYLLVGSNAESFWVYNGETDEYRCGVHGEGAPWLGDVEIKPLDLIEGLGLHVLPPPPAEGRPRKLEVLAQRVTPEFQQILAVAFGQGLGQIEREYWIDRYPPHVVRRVVFRDRDGNIELETRLSDHKQIDGGPLLPHDILVTWPSAEAEMRFRVRKWEFFPQVTPDGPQFRTPRECDG